VKYDDEENQLKLANTLPSFLILLVYRTVEASVPFSTLDERTFVQAIESFIFRLINIADPKAMVVGQYDIDEYLKRRAELLSALGLFEYLNSAALIPVKLSKAPLVSAN